MPAAQQDVLRYLPHRTPFLMIDELVAAETGPAHSRFAILAGNVLVENGQFSEGGLIENIAQTAGAATGLNTHAGGNAPALGYIGAVKDLKIFTLPHVGQTLDTEVIFAHRVMNALIVRGTVHCEGQLLATCELKIFLQS